jgi:thioredoxin-like negative regulator of GroEL
MINMNISLRGDSSSDAMASFAAHMRKGRICVLYYADWCGFCQQLKPEWESLKRQHVNNNRAKFRLVEIESAALAKLKEVLMPTIVDIDSFPTINLYENGALVSSYSGERKADLMLSHFNNAFGPIKKSHKSQSRSRSHSHSHPKSRSHSKSRSHAKPIPKKRKHPAPKLNNILA